MPSYNKCVGRKLTVFCYNTYEAYGFTGIFAGVIGNVAVPHTVIVIFYFDRRCVNIKGQRIDDVIRLCVVTEIIDYVGAPRHAADYFMKFKFVLFRRKAVIYNHVAVFQLIAYEISHIGIVDNVTVASAKLIS